MDSDFFFLELFNLRRERIAGVVMVVATFEASLRSPVPRPPHSVADGLASSRRSSSSQHKQQPPTCMWSPIPLFSSSGYPGYGYGYGYILGPSPVPPVYLAGSFGLVRPAWVRYTRSAVPQNVEGLTRPPPLSARAACLSRSRSPRAPREGVDVVL